MAKDTKDAGSAPIGHVLVVEDDGLLAHSIKATLEDAGAKCVTIVASTAEALEVLREKRPEVLVIDVHLADRDDGWAIAELVDTIGPNPPHIIFSTGAPEDIPEHIVELGDVLEKPYAGETLVELVTAPAGKRKKRGFLDRLRG